MNKVCPHCGSVEIPMVEITSKEVTKLQQMEAHRQARALEAQRKRAALKAAMKIHNAKEKREKQKLRSEADEENISGTVL